AAHAALTLTGVADPCPALDARRDLNAQLVGLALPAFAMASGARIAHDPALSMAARARRHGCKRAQERVLAGSDLARAAAGRAHFRRRSLSRPRTAAHRARLQARDADLLLRPKGSLFQ